MAEQTQRQDADSSPDLLSAATRVCEHARLRVDLLSRQVSLVGFQPPTDYQVAGTTRVVATFVAQVTARYLALVGAIDPRLAIAADAVALSYVDTDLVAAALARTDEHWITQALRSRANGALGPLTPDADSEEEELTFALLRAVSRRVDAEGEPLMNEEDVDYRALERLIWRIAAEVRPLGGRAVADLDEVDRVLTAAAKQFLGPRRRRQPTAAERVARRLLESDADFAALLLAALQRAQPRLFCALIAARLHLPKKIVLPALTEPERLALLLKASDLSDADTTAILMALMVPMQLADDRLIGIVEGFRSLKGQATVEMLRQMRLNPHYRAAIFETERARAAA